jgi:hypothetical protein
MEKSKKAINKANLSVNLIYKMAEIDYERYFNDYYIPPSLSPRQRAERLKEIEEDKIQGYKLHPVVLQKYKESGYIISNWVPTAQQEQEKVFWQTVEKAKNPIVREIQQVYRLKVGGEEKFFYNLEMKSTNKLGAPIHCYKIEGRYEDPEFVPTFSPDTGEQNGSEIASISTKYELNWPEDFTEVLQKQLLPTASYAVMSPKSSRKYGGFDYEDFKERSLEELILFGRTGTFNPVIQKELEKNPKTKVR